MERVVQSDNERMVAGSQDFLLGQGTLDLVALDHLFLAEYCARVNTGAQTTRNAHSPFIAYNLELFFSRTR